VQKNRENYKPRSELKDELLSELTNTAYATNDLLKMAEKNSGPYLYLHLDFGMRLSKETVKDSKIN